MSRQKWAAIMVLAAAAMFTSPKIRAAEAAPKPPAEVKVVSVSTEPIEVKVVPQPGDQRGSDSQPLIITRPEAEREAELEEQREHSQNEKKTADSTEQLTIATVALALFTFMLWLANLKLIKDTSAASDHPQTFFIFQ